MRFSLVKLAPAGVSTWPSEGSDIFGGRHTAEPGRGPKIYVFPGEAGFPFGLFQNDVFWTPLLKKWYGGR